MYHRAGGGEEKGTPVSTAHARGEGAGWLVRNRDAIKPVLSSPHASSGSVRCGGDGFDFACLWPAGGWVDRRSGGRSRGADGQGRRRADLWLRERRQRIPVETGGAGCEAAGCLRGTDWQTLCGTDVGAERRQQGRGRAGSQPALARREICGVAAAASQTGYGHRPAGGGWADPAHGDAWRSARSAGLRERERCRENGAGPVHGDLHLLRREIAATRPRWIAAWRRPSGRGVRDRFPVRCRRRRADEPCNPRSRRSIHSG